MRIPANRYQAVLNGSRWVVMDPRGRIVTAPCGHAQAVQEADRLNADLAARQKRGPRPCMRCGQEFVSDGIHHRLCNPCKHSGVDYLGAYGIAGTLSGRGRRQGLRSGAR